MRGSSLSRLVESARLLVTRDSCVAMDDGRRNELIEEERREPFFLIVTGRMEELTNETVIIYDRTVAAGVFEKNIPEI